MMAAVRFVLGILMKRVAVTVAGIGLVSLAVSAAADVKLPAIFSDNLVLQSGVKCPIWGTAKPGEKVHIAIGDQQFSAQAAEDGKWSATIGPLRVGGPLEMLVKGDNAIRIANVAVGEVWICAGQSNMEMLMNVSGDRPVMNASEERAAADYPLIRTFVVPHAIAAVPLDEGKGQWAVCTTQSIRGFSATAYFFGRDLHKRLGRPVGLIQTSWGGTPLEPWTPPQAVAAEPAFVPIVEYWQTWARRYDEAQVRYRAAYARWEDEVNAAKAAGNPAPAAPRPLLTPYFHNSPSQAYNAMIHPLIPYAIKGAIWYQGEGNVDRAYQYRRTFPALIHGWRQAWNQGDFPFLFVQLANYTPVLPQPKSSEWAELREAQTMALKLPKTGMACAIDIGEESNVHPKNKQDVGARLGLAAMKVAYGRDIVSSGPMYESMQVEGNMIRVKFNSTGGGLVARGESLSGFAVAGKDRQFVWAQAKIEGDGVVVWSANVPKPMAVRYAWANNPVCNLYNGAGLPASPFRTDEWPGVTASKK